MPLEQEICSIYIENHLFPLKRVYSLPVEATLDMIEERQAAAHAAARDFDKSNRIRFQPPASSAARLTPA
jgi:hypothetical protein